MVHGRPNGLTSQLYVVWSVCGEFARELNGSGVPSEARAHAWPGRARGRACAVRASRSGYRVTLV